VLRKTQNAVLLECLSDGRRWSTTELVNAGVGYAAHSRKSDLVNLFGYRISVTRDRARRGESPVYWYRLESVPLEPPLTPSPIESLIEPEAAARLQAMRAEDRTTGARARRLAEIASAPAPAPEQAIDAEQAPLPISPMPAAGGPSQADPAAGGPSLSREDWIAALGEELRAIDAEIVSLRGTLFLLPDDLERLDVLVARGEEITGRLRLLEARAA
jgi:hypothetical protein